MDGHLRLSAKERKTCLQMYRSARAARRALVLLQLSEGLSYRQLRRAALVSPALIAAVKHDFATGGGRPGADRKHMGYAQRMTTRKTVITTVDGN